MVKLRTRRAAKMCKIEKFCANLDEFADSARLPQHSNILRAQHRRIPPVYCLFPDHILTAITFHTRQAHVRYMASIKLQITRSTTSHG